MKTYGKELFFGSLSEVFTFHLQQQHKEPLNMADQKQSGLGGTKPRPQLDALGKFRMAVMPGTKFDGHWSMFCIKNKLFAQLL